MSSKQESNRPDMNVNDPTSQAFEYVAGTLRGEARRQFEQQLQQQPELVDDVHFWEQELINLHQTTPERTPDNGTWKAIESAIVTSEVLSIEQSSKQSVWSNLYQDLHRLYKSWQSGFLLFRPGALALLWAMMATVWLMLSQVNSTSLHQIMWLC